MSSREAELMQAVLAAPDDDAPRLVLADHLTGEGDPRGEFITLQCRLAAAPDDESRRKLRIAENKLLAAHEATWTAPFFEVAKSTPTRKVKVWFHRGFLEEATLPLAALDDLEPLFAVAPLLRRLRFDAPAYDGHPRSPPNLSGRLKSPQLHKVIALELRIPAGGDAAAIALAACPHLGGLRVLRLEASAYPAPDLPEASFSGLPATHLLTAAGARALASSPFLQSLRELTLSSNPIGPAGVGALLASRKLEALDLSFAQLDDGALTMLASSPNSASLQRLVLRAGQFTAAGLETLAASKTLTSLSSLDLSFASVGPAAIARFLSALKLPRLTELSLQGTELGDEGVAVLASSSVSRQFTALELGDNKVTQTGVFTLADSPHLTRLGKLQLNDAWLKKKAVLEYLAASPTLQACRIYVKGTLLGRAKPPKPSGKRATKKAT